MHIGVYSVDQIIRGHDGPRVGLANGDLERLQIELAQGSLGDE